MCWELFLTNITSSKKLKRKAVSLEFKLALVHKNDTESQNVDIATHTELSESTVRTVLKNMGTACY